jgi:branched-chain amino acid aminotransferase
MLDTITYFNGEWKPRSECSLDLSDRGFWVGDAVFDIARTFNGKSFKMREHVERLYRSLKYVRIDPGLTLEEMIDVSEEAVRRNEHLLEQAGDWHVWQAVTRGVSGFRELGGQATVIVQCVQIPFKAFARFYGPGAHGVVTRTRSYSHEALEPKIKHYSRMNFNMAELEAMDVDPEGWPILTDPDGNLAEGIGYNLFIVYDGVIRTPGDSSVLQGASRGAVFEIAEQLGIPVTEEEMQPYDLYNADEAFFSTTPWCVLPVTRADNRQVGDGKPGPITGQLLAAWSEKVGLDIVDQAERFGMG